MATFSTTFFAGFYAFSIFSVCWWIYLAYVHDGAWAYLYLSKQKSSSFLKFSIREMLTKHLEFVSILVCFIIFLCALCDGFSFYFSWIPDRYHLVLGDGSPLYVSTILSCLFGICSAIVFGKWILVGICSYWENRALARQSDLCFEIIQHADNAEQLNTLRKKTLAKIKALERRKPFVPGVVLNRLDLCVKAIELRIRDIEARA